jgi:Transposase DDE domain
MNKGKVGATFEYSGTYIQFLAFLKLAFKISYRTVQGIVRGLSDYIKIEEMHFTHIRRRTLKIKPSIGDLNLACMKKIPEKADNISVLDIAFLLAMHQHLLNEVTIIKILKTGRIILFYDNLSYLVVFVFGKEEIFNNISMY